MMSRHALCKILTEQAELVMEPLSDCPQSANEKLRAGWVNLALNMAVCMQSLTKADNPDQFSGTHRKLRAARGSALVPQ